MNLQIRSTFRSRKYSSALMALVQVFAILAFGASSCRELSDQRGVRVEYMSLKAVQQALELYRLTTGRYPTAPEGLAALTERREGAPLLPEFPVDSWGSPYVYTAPGVHNPGTYDLSSPGPDRMVGTSDDITNWR